MSVEGKKPIRELRSQLPDKEATVKFIAQDGYGFVTLDEDGEDAFFHVDKLPPNVGQTIDKGHKVVVKVTKGKRGLVVLELRFA